MSELYQYEKQTPSEVRKTMDRIENAESKPLVNFAINGIDWEKRLLNRKKRRERMAQTKESTIIKKAQKLNLAKAASHVLCYRSYLDYLIRK